MVMINGEIVVAKSKMTVPTQRFYKFVRKG
jgi:hypothetical protein